MTALLIAGIVCWLAMGLHFARMSACTWADALWLTVCWPAPILAAWWLR